MVLFIYKKKSRYPKFVYAIINQQSQIILKINHKQFES